MSNTGRRRRSTSSIAPSPTSSSPSGSLFPHWKFSQVLGELPPPAAGGHHNGALQDDGDAISAIEFDSRGEYLAAGDDAGRVILFKRTNEDDTPSRAELERTEYAGAPPSRYGFVTEFQSHTQEFDALHSLEIGENIKKLRWCAGPNSSLCMLATNDRTIKLWKVSEHKAPKKGDDQQRRATPASSLQEPYSEWATKKARSSSPDPAEHSEQTGNVGAGYSARCRRVFARGHEYNIISISNNWLVDPVLV